jgi:LysR family nitrogen assimilation transcriptional regulator
VVAEIESATTLAAVIGDGLGATIAPASFARELVVDSAAWQSRIVEPAIDAPLALCQSDHLPLSEPAQAVKEILLELVAEIPDSFPKPKARPQPEATEGAAP